MKTEKTTTAAVAKVEPSPSERFTAMVTAEAGTQLQLTEAQKRLLGNYFVGIDLALKNAETKRASKKNSNETLLITWNNINREELAKEVIAPVRMGLDPLLKAQVYFVPYMNKHTKKYDLGIMPGYNGIKIKGIKYGLEKPDNIRIQIVKESDKFIPLMKSFDRDIENYQFEIPSPFDRGEVEGGFIYKEWYDKPQKNELTFYNKEEIEKRKPKYASAEFWGGEKTKWKNGQPDGKEKVVGWYDEMAEKTLVRIAYGSIPIDSTKIDDAYISMVKNEQRLDQADFELAEEVEEEAMKETIVLPITGKVEPVQKVKAEPEPEPIKKAEPVQEKKMEDWAKPNF